MCLSVCVCLYVCVNVCGNNCVFARPQCKYLILYCVAVCHSASHATINTRGDRRLWIAAVCVGRHQAVNPSRYHWQALRWEINIYSKLPQITSRDFSLRTLCLFFSCPQFLSLCISISLSCFCFFYLKLPISLLVPFLYLHIVSLTLLLSIMVPRKTHSRAGAHADVEHRSCFHSSTHIHTRQLAQKGVQTYTQTCPPHTHIHKHMQGQPEISIWGLSCQTWPMSLSSVIMAVFIFSDRPAGLGASRGVVWTWKHTPLKTSSLAEKRAHSTLTRNW